MSFVAFRMAPQIGQLSSSSSGKYVDDTTAVSSSDDPLDGFLPDAANYLCEWCKVNCMQISVFKTTEIIIYFSKLFGGDFTPALKTGNTQIRRV